MFFRIIFLFLGLNFAQGLGLNLQLPTTCQLLYPIQTPQTFAHLQSIVNWAVSIGIKFKAIVSTNTISLTDCSGGVLIDMSAFNYTIMNADSTISVGAGARLKDVGSFLLANGRALLTPSFESLTINNAIETGKLHQRTNGTILNWKTTISDQIVGMRIFNSKGVFYNITDPTNLASFSSQLGLLVEVTFATWPATPTPKCPFGDLQMSDYDEGGCVSVPPENPPQDIITGYNGTWYLPMGSKYAMLIDPEAYMGRPVRDEEELAQMQTTTKLYLYGNGSVGIIRGYKNTKEYRIYCILKGYKVNCYCHNRQFKDDLDGNLGFPDIALSEDTVDCSKLNPHISTIIQTDVVEKYWLAVFCAGNGKRFWLAVSQTPQLSPKAKSDIRLKILQTGFFQEKYFAEQKYT